MAIIIGVHFMKKPSRPTIILKGKICAVDGVWRYLGNMFGGFWCCSLSSILLNEDTAPESAKYIAQVSLDAIDHAELSLQDYLTHRSASRSEFLPSERRSGCQWYLISLDFSTFIGGYICNLKYDWWIEGGIVLDLFMVISLIGFQRWRGKQQEKAVLGG